MPFSFTVVGWEDSEGDRHTGPPGDLDDTIGVYVHVREMVYEDDDEYQERGLIEKADGEHHYFWAWQGGTSSQGGFQTWDEWYVYIGALMDGHGMDLA
jgi:hypothetical protein